MLQTHNLSMASKKISIPLSCLRNFYHPPFFLQKMLRTHPHKKKFSFPCGIHDECSLSINPGEDWMRFQVRCLPVGLWNSLNVWEIFCLSIAICFVQFSILQLRKNRGAIISFTVICHSISDFPANFVVSVWPVTIYLHTFIHNCCFLLFLLIFFGLIVL